MEEFLKIAPDKTAEEIGQLEQEQRKMHYERGTKGIGAYIENYPENENLSDKQWEKLLGKLDELDNSDEKKRRLIVSMLNDVHRHYDKEVSNYVFDGLIDDSFDNPEEFLEYLKAYPSNMDSGAFCEFMDIYQMAYDGAWVDTLAYSRQGFFMDNLGGGDADFRDSVSGLRFSGVYKDSAVNEPFAFSIRDVDIDYAAAEDSHDYAEVRKEMGIVLYEAILTFEELYMDCDNKKASCRLDFLKCYLAESTQGHFGATGIMNATCTYLEHSGDLLLSSNPDDLRRGYEKFRDSYQIIDEEYKSYKKNLELGEELIGKKMEEYSL